MKIFISLFLAITLFISTEPKYPSLSRVSRAISKEQRKEGHRRWEVNKFHSIRMEQIKSERFDVFQNSDTVFLLEAYDFVTKNAFFGCIWDRKRTRWYAQEGETLNINKHYIFSKYMRGLIEEWNVNGIREEEKAHPTIGDISNICGCMVIRSAKELKVHCINFNDFFVLERDRKEAQWGW